MWRPHLRQLSNGPRSKYPQCEHFNATVAAEPNKLPLNDTKGATSECRFGVIERLIGARLGNKYPSLARSVDVESRGPALPDPVDLPRRA
jgi:hypothetical protein